MTIRIERTGDIANESLTVTYSTLDFGSADDGTDYTAKTDTLTFNPGESFKDITIDINEADGLAEGFERFRVMLSNASAGYLITNGSPTSSGNPNGEATITIIDANVSVATFQNGVNGYTGTTDAYPRRRVRRSTNSARIPSSASIRPRARRRPPAAGSAAIRRHVRRRAGSGADGRHRSSTPS